MKKNLLFITICLLAFNQSLIAQGFDKPQYQIITHRGGVYLGTFNIELFPLIAPLATANFDSLVTALAYDYTAFHRVVPGFVIQGGDPNSISGPVSTWGNGNPNQPNVNAEFSAVHHYRGRLGAARDANINSANSQFYFSVETNASTLSLDGNYTVYGQVISGIDIVDTIVNSPTVGTTERPVQKIEMFITYTGTNDSVPDAPTLATPLNNAVGVLATTNFTWSAVASAVMYTVEFSTDSLFSTIAFTKDDGDTATTIAAIQSATNYYWRVKANNGGHESVYSNVFYFHSYVLPPTQIEPHDTATNVVLNPVFSWTDVEPLSDYRLQISVSSTFNAANIIYDQSGVADTTHQSGNILNANTTYWWRVRSAAGAPNVYSAKHSFTTGTSLGLHDYSSLLLNSIYPNPANDIITIEAFIQKPQVVEIVLNDDTGKQVYHQAKIATQQQFITTIDVSKMQQGIYILYIKSGGDQIVRKVTIQ